MRESIGRGEAPLFKSAILFGLITSNDSVFHQANQYRCPFILYKVSENV